MKKRVVITGIGLISSFGIGKDIFWNNIKQGNSGINIIKNFNTEQFPVKIAAEIEDFSPEKIIQNEKILSRSSKFTQLGLVATIEAIKDSNLVDIKSERSGVMVGTAVGGIDFAFKQYQEFINKGPLAINPFTTAVVLPNACAVTISIMFGIKGACQTFTTSCSASADAIGFGFNLIKNGILDVAIVGGAESPLSPPIFSSLCLSKILSVKNEKPIKTPSPFDKMRDGTVVGEGSAILIIEDLDCALNRGTNIYAEIIGYSSSSDAYHIVNPDPEGTQGIRTLNLALEEAGIKPEQVDYINAHGTGTVKNDKVETAIIKEIFKKHAYKMNISSTKSMTGHLWGASGAIETVICALSLKNGIIPPTINYEHPDSECDLDYVPNKAREKEINVAVSNSFGLGGQNAVLVFKKYDN